MTPNAPEIVSPTASDLPTPGSDLLIVDPFMGGSHKSWAEGYARHSSLQVELMGMSAHHWKWRMHGGAVSLSRQYKSANHCPRLILASSMLDLGSFLALLGDATRSIPTALYFHENQLTYPWSNSDADPSLGRDRHYAFINYTSALIADQVLFNSHFHKESFLGALPKFLAAFPDYKELETVELIAVKSAVLHLGMELSHFDSAIEMSRAEKINSLTTKGFTRVVNLAETERPVLLWNHRWEQDKGPALFLQLLRHLREQEQPFWLLLLGEQFARLPEALLSIREEFSDSIIYEGFVEEKEDYRLLMSLADVFPVCNAQDFFGLSVVEGLYAGAYPILPEGLVYREHFAAPGSFSAPTLTSAIAPAASSANPPELEQYFYKHEAELFEKTLQVLRLKHYAGQHAVSIRNFVNRYDWQNQAPRYDQTFRKMLAGA